MTVAARREVARQLQEKGLSERRALKLVGMSASTLRYRVRDDGNGRLRERLTELAGQHRRHGYRMLHSARLQSLASRGYGAPSFVGWPPVLLQPRVVCLSFCLGAPP